MNRRLIVLFGIKTEVIKEIGAQLIEQNGYTIIHKHSFPNDEPPYILVSFWGRTTTYTLQKAKEASEDGEEEYAFFLIRTEDVDQYIQSMNSSQRDYCDAYLEGILTRNAGEHSLPPAQYASGITDYLRKPKTKRIYEIPHQLQRAIATTVSA